MIKTLPHHPRAAPHLRRGQRGVTGVAVAAHALAEIYSTVTALPLSPRITPGQAGQMIRKNILSCAEIVPLNGVDYEAVIQRMIGLGLPGGAIYDALHVRAAEKAGVDQLLTFNRRDFERMPPEDPVTLTVL